MSRRLPRVAILLPQLSGGGISRTRTTLAKGLLEAGLSDVEFLLERRDGALQHLLPTGATMVVLGQQRFRKLVPALVRYIQDRRPDLLLTSKELHSFAAVLAKSTARVPLRIYPTTHGDYNWRLLNNRRPSERFWLPLATRLFYNHADGVIAVSDSVADSIAAGTGIPRARITTINNPIDLSSVTTDAYSAPTDAPWLAPDAAWPCILAAGRLAPQKGYPDLLRAFAILRQTRPARLLILGEGSERPHLQALAARLGVADDVGFAGFKANPFPYIARCQAFALSSVSEGFPGVLVQALALGCSIVSTRAGAAAEILEDGRFGRLVAIGDVQGLAAALGAAIDERRDPDALRQRASQFDMLRIARRYAELTGLDAATDGDLRTDRYMDV